MYYHRIQSAFAESTKNNFKYQVTEFVNFCLAHMLPIFPPSPMNVARYLTSCSIKVTAYGTIMNKLSSVKKFYQLTGHILDVSSPIIDLLTRACKRDMSSSSKPKAPLEPGHLILINHMIDPSDVNHRLFQCALLIQFFTCIRKSNLLPPSIRGFSVKRQLTRGDIHLLPTSLLLTFPWTKTLQNSEDIFTLSIAQVPDSILDPVSLYKTFVRDFPLPANMPAFSLQNGTKLLVLTQQNYIDMLKHFLTRLGLPAESYSSHSVRRSGTTTLWQSGASQELIKAHGGWKSGCYERYIAVGQKHKLIPTTKMLHHINNMYK